MHEPGAASALRGSYVQHTETASYRHSASETGEGLDPREFIRIDRAVVSSSGPSHCCGLSTHLESACVLSDSLVVARVLGQAGARFLRFAAS